MRLHGGKVEASSQLGKGTSFRVSIPFGVSHLPSDQIKHIARFAPLTHSSSSSVSPRGITNPSAFSSSSSSSSSTSSSYPSSPRSQPASSSPSPLTSSASSSTSSSSTSQSPISAAHAPLPTPPTTPAPPTPSQPAPSFPPLLEQPPSTPPPPPPSAETFPYALTGDSNGSGGAAAYGCANGRLIPTTDGHSLYDNGGPAADSLLYQSDSLDEWRGAQAHGRLCPCYLD